MISKISIILFITLMLFLPLIKADEINTNRTWNEVDPWSGRIYNGEDNRDRDKIKPEPAVYPTLELSPMYLLFIIIFLTFVLIREINKKPAIELLY